MHPRNREEAVVPRKMYDSVDISAIPAAAELVGCYTDGKYANDAAAKARFPNATLIRITVFGGTLGAEVVDCETGDVDPPTAAAWAQHKHVAEQHGTIYCSQSVVPSVVAACKALGLVRGRDYSIFQAHYDGVAEIPDGCVAKQYADHGPNGEHYDLSVVADYWPGVDPPKVEPRKPYVQRAAAGIRRAVWKAFRFQQAHHHPNVARRFHHLWHRLKNIGAYKRSSK